MPELCRHQMWCSPRILWREPQCIAIEEIELQSGVKRSLNSTIGLDSMKKKDFEDK